MKGVMPVILLKVLIITLIQAVCIGLWFVFFIILTDTNSHYNEGSFLAVILDWGILAGIIALNTSFANYYCEQKKDVTRFFYGRKMAEYEVQRSVNQEYKKVKPVIIIVHVVAIVAFNFACGMLKSDKGFIQTVILALPTVVYRIIFRIIGTVCFIKSMIKYCKSYFYISVRICRNCGRVTNFERLNLRTIKESYTEEDEISIGSYTTTKKIGELRDSYGNSCDVYSDVEHDNTRMRTKYHPGVYEGEYKCVLCGYTFHDTFEA